MPKKLPNKSCFAMHFHMSGICIIHIPSVLQSLLFIRGHPISIRAKYNRSRYQYGGWSSGSKTRIRTWLQLHEDKVYWQRLTRDRSRVDWKAVSVGRDYLYWESTARVSYDNMRDFRIVLTQQQGQQVCIQWALPKVALIKSYIDSSLCQGHSGM